MLSIDQNKLIDYMDSVAELQKRYIESKEELQSLKERASDYCHQISKMKRAAEAQSLLLEELYNTIKEVESKLTPDASAYYNAKLGAGLDIGV